MSCSKEQEKSKLKAYTIEEKLNIIERIRKGTKKAEICRELNLPESTLRGWLKNEDKMRAFIDNMESDSGLLRKRSRTAQNTDLDKCMFDFFVAKRNDGVPLSGPVLQMQAKNFNEALGGSEHFKCSRGWLNRWKKRHGVSQVTISGESRSADVQAAEEFLPKLQEMVEREGLSAEQLFNADETALYFRMMPQKTLAQAGDIYAKTGFKQDKNRMTLLFACNWTGISKLKPLAIGKLCSPRCFHHVNMEPMPLQYANSNNAWMTTNIFESWFKESFIPAVRRHLRSKGIEEKACLLLDNCPAHPPANSLKSSDGKIFVFYLPKNTTSKIQPLDQGIISAFKRNYRYELVKAVVSTETDLTTYLKNLNLKDAFYLASDAWDSVKPQSIQACWDKALGNPFEHEIPNDPEQFEEIENIEVLEESVPDGMTVHDFIENWAQIDDDENVAGERTEDEIVKDVLGGANEDEDEEDEPEQAESESLIPHSKALEATELLLKYFEQQGSKVRAQQIRSSMQEIRKKKTMTVKSNHC
jgi:hypothetical protein